MKVAGITDVGLKRESNEDNFLIDEEQSLFIVADGMGGHRAGETASRLAIDEIGAYLRQENQEEKTPTEIELDEVKKIRKSLALAIESANHKIVAKSREGSEYKGMGTTVVACLQHHDVMVAAHVGDSRLYLVRNGDLTQMTKDHSRVQELIDLEKITVEEAKQYPLRNVITRALGGDISVEVDLNDFATVSTDAWLLCSDGLSSVLGEDLIGKVIVHYAGEPYAACEKLIELVKKAGAPDNVTIVLIEGDDFGRGYDTTTPIGDFQLYPQERRQSQAAGAGGFWSKLFAKFKS